MSAQAPLRPGQCSYGTFLGPPITISEGGGGVCPFEGCVYYRLIDMDCREPPLTTSLVFRAWGLGATLFSEHPKNQKPQTLSPKPYINPKPTHLDAATSAATSVPVRCTSTTSASGLISNIEYESGSSLRWGSRR